METKNVSIITLGNITMIAKMKMNIPKPSPKLEKTLDKVEPMANKEKEKEKENTLPRLSFNDNDSVLDMGTNKSSLIEAPKTIERLDKIAKENDAKRKAEEAGFDDDYEEDKLTIHSGDSIKLKLDDLGSLDKKSDTPSLNIEVLS